METMTDLAEVAISFALEHQRNGSQLLTVMAAPLALIANRARNVGDCYG
jgi:hypothetical protein